MKTPDASPDTDSTTIPGGNAATRSRVSTSSPFAETWSTHSSYTTVPVGATR